MRSPLALVNTVTKSKRWYMQVGTGKKDILAYWWWEWKSIQTLWENIMKVPQKKTYNSSRQPPFFSPPPAVTDIWDLIPWLEDLRLKSFTNTNLLMNIHKNENSLSKRYLHSYVDHSAIHNTQHKGNELSVHNGICSSAIKRWNLNFYKNMERTEGHQQYVK